MPNFLTIVILTFSIILLGGHTTSADDIPPEVAKLIKDLEDKNATIRFKAAKQLGELKGKAKGAIPALTAATSDSDELVRAVAKRAISAIKEAVETADAPKGAADAPKGEDKLNPTKPKGEDKLKSLIKNLQSKNMQAQLKAIAELELLGSDAKPAGAALVEFGMMNSNPKVREAANTAFEKIDPEIYKQVLTILVDNNYFNRFQAVDNLRKMGANAKAAVPAIKMYYGVIIRKKIYPSYPYPVIKALIEIVPEDLAVQQEVLRSVAAKDDVILELSRGVVIETYRKELIEDMRILKIDPKKQVEALLAGLAVSQKDRVLIINELAKMGTDAKAALPVLMKHKTDRDKNVREAATAAVDAINK